MSIPEAAARSLPSLGRHIWVTLINVSGGFFFGVLFGGVGGTLAFLYPSFRDLTMPLLNAFRGISALALFPAIILLIGIGVESKWFVLFWTAWAGVWLNTYFGLASVDSSLIDAALLDTKSHLAIWRYVRLPLSLPLVVTGIRIGLSGAWVSLISAEMLGSNAGLGYFIMQSAQTFHFAALYWGVIVLALLNFGFQALFEALQTFIDKRYL